MSEKDKGNYVLKIKDNGKPFPEELEIDKTNTLGIKLIKNLVNQLDGKITLHKENKEFLIEFNELKYKERI